MKKKISGSTHSRLNIEDMEAFDGSSKVSALSLRLTMIARELTISENILEKCGFEKIQGDKNGKLHRKSGD